MKLLVVEDDYLTRSALSRILRLIGINDASVAGTADEAIKAIGRDPPDVILTDWDLDDSLSGIDVVNYLLTVNAEATVIFMTGKSIDELRTGTRHLAVHRYLQKPFGLDVLTELVSELRSRDVTQSTLRGAVQ